MTYRAFGYRLPELLSAPLFGDRRRFGLVPQTDDPCWQEWLDVYLRFYDSNQQQSAGAVVNGAGYRVMQQVDMTGKTVLEIGPGDIHHLPWWRGRPDCFYIGDIQQPMLDRSAARLAKLNIPHQSVLLERRADGKLPFTDAQFDAVVSFYSLEHLYPLERYLEEMMRVLRPGGVLIGAIPAERGLAWGLGRYLTSRRWLKRNTNINPDKIICWEHPNFADEILNTLDRHLTRRSVRFWPLGVPSIDLNLVIKFVYEKR
ncbi:class I SAM-dependent methyltransferase [Achromobacter xylosoxidans]